MAHEQGTSTTETTGYASGSSSGYSAGGGFGTASHNMSISSTSKTRTAFAERAAPPKNWFGIWRTNAIVSGVFVFLTFATAHSPLVIAFGLVDIVMAPLLLVSLIGLAITFPTRDRYREAKARWDQSWICAACGNIFIPGESQ